MPDPLRVSAQEVIARRSAGKPVLLVCAYDDDQSYHLSKLEGAIPYSEFKARQASISKEEEIVFY